MPTNLSHGLFAVLVCGISNIILGMQLLSSSIFFAGFFAMIINLDHSGKEQVKRTPWGHSLTFSILWTNMFIAILSILCILHLLDGILVFELSLGFVVAYGTHIALDFFTTDGIFIPVKDGWRKMNSKLIGIEPEDDGSTILNIYLSIPSAVGIMVLIGLSG
jgi:hypothetical protein